MNKGALIRAILPLLCIDPPARAEGIAVPPRNDLYHGVYPGGESGDEQENKTLVSAA